MQLSLLHLCVVLFSKIPLLLADTKSPKSDACGHYFAMVAISDAVKVRETQLEGIEGIEKKVFDFPWTKEEFDTYLRSKNQRGFVAQQDGKIVGYVLFEEGPTQIKIDNIAVDPAFARSGIGEALIRQVIENGNKEIIALTRETNLKAQLFFKKLGFKADPKLNKKPFMGSDEDGIQFRLSDPVTIRGAQNKGPLPVLSQEEIDQLSIELVGRPDQEDYRQVGKLTPEISQILRDSQLTGIMDIENKVFEFPWTRGEFKDYLKTADQKGLVAQLDGKTVGYVVYKEGPARISIDGIAVDPKYMRRGLGEALVQNVLSDQKKREVVVTIRERNVKAQIFFKGLGFQADPKLKKSLYEGTDEDAVIMRLRSPDGTLRGAKADAPLPKLSASELKKLSIELVDPNLR